MPLPCAYANARRACADDVRLPVTVQATSQLQVRHDSSWISLSKCVTWVDLLLRMSASEVPSCSCGGRSGG